MARGTEVPDFVTESGYTTDIRSRAKVGGGQPTYESYVYDRQKDTSFVIRTTQIPGIYDKPDYAKDYPGRDTAKAARGVIINGPYWSEKGTHAIVNIRSQDNKDRWIMLLDGATGKLSPVDRQRDEAWWQARVSAGAASAGSMNKPAGSRAKRQGTATFIP